jgi:hypothetical protein
MPNDTTTNNVDNIIQQNVIDNTDSTNRNAFLNTQAAIDAVSAVDQEINSNLKSSINIYKYFNRFRIPEEDPFTSNIAYVFFTKPDLNIDGNVDNDNYFSRLNSTSFGKAILSSLSMNSYNDSTDSSVFIKILSNSVSNFETKDTTMKTDELYQNYIGYKMTMPYTFIDSITSDSITFNFLEYDDLRITHLMKAWITYMHNIKRGIFSPTDDNRNRKILDYGSTAYFFYCGPDGHSIKFFTKLTGLFPINIPYSSFSWEVGSNPDLKKLSVQFQYQIKEDLDPEIIADFLILTGNEDGSLDPTIRKDTLADNWASAVTILTNSSSRTSGLYFYNK